MIATKINEFEFPMASSTGGSDVLPDHPQSVNGPGEPDSAAADRGSERRMRISAMAYAKAASRDFSPGRELDDWLEAERQIDDELAARASVERTEE